MGTRPGGRDAGRAGVELRFPRRADGPRGVGRDAPHRARLRLLAAVMVPGGNVGEHCEGAELDSGI